MLGRSLRPMMKDQELVGFERQFGVGLPLIVGEFDLIRAVQEFHDGPDLAAQKAMCWHGCEQSYDIKQARERIHAMALGS